MTRELVWGLPVAAREIRRWQTRALEIPDAAIRQDALSALARKRGQADGAGLFSILPRHRSPGLLRLLVSYQITWDFLDSVNEHGAAAGQTNGRQLHLALIEAFDQDRPISDYYRHHPWKDDGGYLPALVQACRHECARLPSYARVRALVVQEATRAQVLAINHDLDPAMRDATLRAWASRERPVGCQAAWFELSGAASAGLAIFALLALATEPACTDADIAQSQSAYFPWVSAVATMIDSYVDQIEDIANDDHSYIAHYPTPQLAVRRIHQLTQQGLSGVGALPNGERHILIVACMIAMYLSKDSARTSEMQPTSRRLLRSGESLARWLAPVLRAWRMLYSLRDT